MNLPNEKFCVLPWISLEATPTGTVRPCCLADDELVDNAGEKFSLSRADFVSIQNSLSMQGLRQQFLAGQQPQTCRRCWQEERAGRRSKRMHTLDRLKHIVGEQTWTEHARPLMFLDLKLGNICNLKCRICGSWSSSQSAVEEISFLPAGQKKQSVAYQMLQAGSWPRENTGFWDQIDSHLTHIRYIEFTGGEPFLIDQHFDMLQGMVDRGIAHNVEIHYNTNGTQYPPRGEAIWRHFRKVEIAFSIDDVGSRFEYQRSNAEWKLVCDNMDRFRDLKEIYPCVHLQICATVNVFNVRYIDQLAVWLDRNTDSFEFVYWNVMHDAWYFSIACLPDPAKRVVADHLRSAAVPEQYRKEFDHIIEFMNNGASTDGFITRMKIRDLDQKRMTNFRDSHPEMADIIEYE